MVKRQWGHDPAEYRQTGLGIPEDEMRQDAKQPILKHRIRADSIYLKKSKEAFLLAIELFNKPLISYRIESFCALFINAWELLMKAKIFADSGNQQSSIMRDDSQGLAKPLTECIKLLLLNKPDAAIRQNIEYIAELRNSALHLSIPHQGIEHARVFQSGVINYTNKLKQWFPDTDTSLLPSNMLALVSLEEGLSDISSIKRDLGKDNRKLLKRWQKKFKNLQALGNEGRLENRL